MLERYQQFGQAQQTGGPACCSLSVTSLPILFHQGYPKFCFCQHSFTLTFISLYVLVATALQVGIQSVQLEVVYTIPFPVKLIFIKLEHSHSNNQVCLYDLQSIRCSKLSRQLVITWINRNWYRNQNNVTNLVFIFILIYIFLF